jgi:hypothetical protein
MVMLHKAIIEAATVKKSIATPDKPFIFPQLNFRHITGN